ncbi:lipocalin family protein [Geothrix sp. PMB-07]|uniref:lipocalin family protein n=1 Tax=Geothrix sp. PMB-07 TaxID=3068640 RepID=UPI002741AADF|nr:lipocalin family protein [Geothrix sp. PMB-07]WLT32595.1 lipocalin family protein [Geothrix sp. PMB-07]
MTRSLHLLTLGWLLTMLGCTGVPDGVKPVQGFDLNRYLGQWHEVARLDHGFERGLTQVTATYSLRPDGSVKVLNRGWDATSGKWKVAEGRALFVGAASEGRLKVSFFGPFYGAYTVIELEPERYSMICGPSRSYFWILARQPKLDAKTLERLLDRARALGFATDQLIYP